MRPILDVSGWQPVINYKQASADISGAIIRIGGTGYGDSHVQYGDDYFYDHYSGFRAAGVKLGAYFYAGAITEAGVDVEVELCLQMLAGRDWQLPIYYDVEAPGDYADLSRDRRTDLALRWITAMHKAGYHVGIYASLSWANHMIDMDRMPDYVSIWIAQYYDECEYQGRYELWQFTSSGRISGINGNVDLSDPMPGYFDGQDQDQEEDQTPAKTIAQLAEEVLADLWGSGDARRENLTAAGYDYDAVQDEVNRILEEEAKATESGIEAAQRWLDVKITGLWNHETNVAAIMRLQAGINEEYNGDLDVDGIIGPLTKAAMPHLGVEDTGLCVQVLQAGLNRYGYDLDIDGIFGDLTAGAVISYQSQTGLDVDGIAGPQTLSSIFTY